jgi:hypothetical protein
MPAPPEPQNNSLELFSLISSALGSFWAWLLPMIGGIFHLGKIHQKINQLEKVTDNLADLPLQVKEVSTKLDMLLEDRNRRL